MGLNKYPVNIIDRVLFWIFLICSIGALIIVIKISLPFGLIILFALFCGLLSTLVSVPIKTDRKDIELLAEFDNIQKSITRLVAWIEKERSSVINIETTLENLKREKDELEKIVDSDRDVINLILKYSKINKHSQMKNIVKGFSLGVASSLAATAISKYFLG